MYRVMHAIVCVSAMFVFASCGSDDTNRSASDADGEAAACTAGGDSCDGEPVEETGDEADDEPQEDPNKWLKVTAPAPEGWHTLSKDGRNEILKPDYNLLNEPPVEFRYVLGYSSEEAPHASSGTDEEWAGWREGASVVVVYAVSKTADGEVATLKEHGGAFVDGFDESRVGDRPGFATYIDGEKWLACVNNANGTYVFAALVRSDEDGELMKTFPNQLKPE